MKIWSTFRGKTEERLSVQDWAEMFNFNGNTYPLGINGMSYGNKQEQIDNDFVGYVQGAYKSSGVVFACCMARALIFTEMRFQYQTLTSGRPGDLRGSPDLGVLEKPWPNGTTGELLSRAMQDTDLAGNNYVVREGAGPNARLRRLRPDWTSIVLSAPPAEAVMSDVTGYVYRPGNTTNPELWKLYPIGSQDMPVAHWSPIPDPEAQYRGMSWLTPVLREIMADKAALVHKQKFFTNAATPNLAVSFKETVTAAQFKQFMTQMDSTHAGPENAYKTLYLGGGADVHVIGANMQQMAFKDLMGQSETRISAAARVPPMIVGWSEGTKGSLLTDMNLQAGKDLLGNGTLRPLWRSICAAYETLVPEQSGSRLWYDDRDIAFLRQDRKEVAELRQAEADTITSLVMNGYTPESASAAVMQEDWRLLEHTGLFSVQLQLPGTTPGDNATDPGVPGQGADKAGSPGKGADKPATNGKGTPPDATKTKGAVVK